MNINETVSVWSRLEQTKKPIVIYGMGDGALKIMKVFAEKNIKLSDIFASDEYVRGHSFEGYKVLRYAEVCEKYDDFVIVVAFAVHDEPMMNRLYELSARHELYAPDVPVAGGGLFTPEYLESERESFEKAYSLLADDVSRKTFEAVINFKISGKIEYLCNCTLPVDEMYTGIIKPDESESYVDLGAYDGDTIRELLSFTNGRFKAITALEPDAKNYKKLVQKLPLAVKEEDADRVALYNMGAWNREEVQTFAVRAGRNSSLAKKGVEVQMNSVDNLLCGEKATIIKLDVEGAEYNALLGCEKTIKAYKPKLMISSYHRNEDLFALPLLVNKICPEYRFYLRHHPYIPAWETNYYAVAND